MRSKPTVLFEDESIVAIDKPSGLVVHKGVNTEETLADWILETYPEMASVGETYADEKGNDIQRPGIVHRLDKDTSGVMVLAKTQDIFLALKKLFQKGKVKKEYRAFVYGTHKRKRGIINLPIGRSEKRFNVRTTHNPRGAIRDAKTEYVIVGECGALASYVRFYPHTGRMHQIRVHAKALQIPIVADPLYAASREPILGFERLALHSHTITIPLYTKDKPIEVSAELPEDFQAALKHCELRKFDATA